MRCGETEPNFLCNPTPYFGKIEGGGGFRFRRFLVFFFACLALFFVFCFFDRMIWWGTRNTACYVVEHLWLGTITDVPSGSPPFEKKGNKESCPKCHEKHTSCQPPAQLSRESSPFFKDWLPNRFLCLPVVLTCASLHNPRTEPHFLSLG